MTTTRPHSGRWVVRIEPRGATAADVAVLLPLCESMLEQAELVAGHYDLPHGCAQSICFYLSSDSPSAVPTSFSRNSWPIAFDSYLPLRDQSKVEIAAAPVALPLPSCAASTGLPICATLSFDFGLDQEEAEEADNAQAVPKSARWPGPTPISSRPSLVAKIRATTMKLPSGQPTPTALTPHAYYCYPGRSSSVERRSSFQEMPYANLEDSPSPRAAIFSGPFSPATRRMRAFAFNTGLRRRVSSNAASPFFRSLARMGTASAAVHGPASATPIGSTVKEEEHDGLLTGCTWTQVRHRNSFGEFDGRAAAGPNSACTILAQRLAWSDAESGDDGSTTLSSSPSSASLEAFRRSRSSLFSSTQGTTVWNEDDTFFEDARARVRTRTRTRTRSGAGVEASIEMARAAVLVGIVDATQRRKATVGMGIRAAASTTVTMTPPAPKLINASPAGGTLARRRALTMSNARPAATSNGGSAGKAVATFSTAREAMGMQHSLSATS